MNTINYMHKHYLPAYRYRHWHKTKREMSFVHVCVYKCVNSWGMFKFKYIGYPKWKELKMNAISEQKIVKIKFMAHISFSDVDTYTQ